MDIAGQRQQRQVGFLSALQHVLGPFAWSAPFATFAMQGRRGGGHSEELANLEGRRFVTASEAAEGTPSTKRG